MHPYAAACAAAGLLLIIGAILVESRTSVRPNSLSVWGGTGAPLLNPTSYSPQAIVSNIREDSGTTDLSPTYIPPRSASDDGETPSQEELDFDSFLASLVQPAGHSSASSSTSADTALAYSLIPQGLISTTTSSGVRNPVQQALYTYGNEAASYIQTYEDSYRNAPTTLRDQAEDRQNVQKGQAVKLVASGLRTAGEGLLSMEEVPELAVSAHEALAKSYIEVGKTLANVPDANGDGAFITAVTAYNEVADTLVKNYVSLATIFSLNAVKFAPDDPGSIFMFSGGGGL